MKLIKYSDNQMIGDYIWFWVNDNDEAISEIFESEEEARKLFGLESHEILDITRKVWYNRKMEKLSYHGKTPEQARWVLENFATPEVREMHKNNKSFNQWLEDCHAVLEAERLSY